VRFGTPRDHLNGFFKCGARGRKIASLQGIHPLAIYRICRGGVSRGLRVLTLGMRVSGNQKNRQNLYAKSQRSPRLAPNIGFTHVESLRTFRAKESA
jgi:hypothetical protein